jgi:hypothetical protein
MSRRVRLKTEVEANGKAKKFFSLLLEVMTAKQISIKTGICLGKLRNISSNDRITLVTTQETSALEKLATQEKQLFKMLEDDYVRKQYDIPFEIERRIEKLREKRGLKKSAFYAEMLRKFCEMEEANDKNNL